MRRPALALALCLPLAVVAQTPSEDRSAPDKTQTATTQTPTTPTQTPKTQGAGKDGKIGEHVSSVAPEHPLAERERFGECVSELAITGECTHEHDE